MLIGAATIGLLVTVAILTDTWLYMAMAACGLLFVVFAIAHPRSALLLWLLAAPVANAYATVTIPGVPDIMFGRVAVLVVSAALLLRVMLKGRPLAAFGALELAMATLLAVMSLDLLRSGTPTSDAMQNFDEFVTPVILLLAARNLFGARADIKKVASVLVVVGCYLALHGTYQYFVFNQPDSTSAPVDLAVHEGGQRVNESHLQEGRAVGPFTSAVEYGSVVAITLLGALFLTLYQTSGLFRVAAAALVPLIAAAVVMCSTRSPWLGAFLAVVLMAALDRRRKILLASIAALTVAGVIGALVFLPADSALEERASSFEPLRARLVMYEIGARIAVRRPLVGYGRGAPSRIAARKELYAMGSADAEYAAGQFHNVFLMLLVEWGLVALLAYLAILALIVRAAILLRRRRAREQDLLYHFAGLVLAATVVFVTQGLFVDTPPFLYLNGLYFFLAGLLLAQFDAMEPVDGLEPARSYGLGVNLSPSGGAVRA
jgi:O-antigen ligase